jgi:hypothetical protein
MRTLISKTRFIKAVTYANEHFFSEPYSITPMFDRWFNQLSVVELQDGKIVHLSNEVAQKHVSITLNDRVLSVEEVAALVKFHGKDASFAKERAAMEARLQALASTPKNKTKREELSASIAKFDDDKQQAQQNYDAIMLAQKATPPTVTTEFNKVSFEAEYGTKVKKIMHRPNHGLTHSVRAAYSIPMILAYREKNGTGFSLTEPQIEKLQLMMLFSVVGRRDETGFNDGVQGRATYESFRATSGKAYQEYVSSHAQELYPEPNSLEKRYRDAMVVELMGYSSIDDFLKRRVEPPLDTFVRYVIEAEQQRGYRLKTNETPEQHALLMIQSDKYRVGDLFPLGAIRNEADALLCMMNDAHGLDLSRCYTLYPAKAKGSAIIKNFDYFLHQANFFDGSSTASSEKLASFFQLLRWNFDALEATGNKSMFGLLTAEEFGAKKDSVVSEINEIMQSFANPSQRVKLLKEANAAHDAEETVNHFSSSKAHVQDTSAEDKLLKEYCKHKIIKLIATQLTTDKPLQYTANMFRFNQLKKSDLKQVQHHASGAALVNELETLTHFPDVTSSLIERPFISAVKHNKEEGTATLTFDTIKDAHLFRTRYKEMYDDSPFLDIVKSGEKWVITADRKNYKQLVKDQLLEFQLVTVPKKLEREEFLVDAEGNIDALTLIAESKALVRLVSTSDLDGSAHPDYDYMLDSLDDPVHNRYAAAVKDKGSWKADRTRYQDPRDGRQHIRDLVKPADLRFQEPITEPRSFEERVDEGLTISDTRGSAKNTIFTKKMACSTMPASGRTTPFPGYLAKQSNYFPIGILSDRTEVDLKEGRYSWSANVVSHTKFWVRDTSNMDLAILTELNAKTAGKNILLRNKDGTPLYDNEELLPPKGLVDYKGGITDKSLGRYVRGLEQRLTKIQTSFENKFYRPTTEFLRDCSHIIENEKALFIKHCPAGPNKLKGLEHFDRMLEQINQEGLRTGVKYSIPITEVTRKQNEQEGSAHNEVLAGLAKKAVRALYASKDTLLDRLNLAFHASRIKEKYGYDVPLLITSSDKAPYNYTEAMIKADLLEAYQHLQANTFPYDKTEFPVYELDSNNDVIVNDDGTPKVKKNGRGQPQSVAKNLDFQKSLLLDIFKLGVPELTKHDELVSGSVSGQEIDPEAAIAKILEHMDVIGSLHREEQLMEEVIAIGTQEKQESFLLRSIALGHESLVSSMLEKPDFKITETMITKAIALAQKKEHTEITTLLNSWMEPINAQKNALTTRITELAALPTTSVEEQANKVKIVLLIEKDYQELAKKFQSPELAQAICVQKEGLLLNTVSCTVENKERIEALTVIAREKEDFLIDYLKLINTEKPVSLSTLLKLNVELDSLPLKQTMAIMAASDEATALTYAAMLDKGYLEQAELFGKDPKQSTEELKAQCRSLIEDIKQQAWGEKDSLIDNFCTTKDDSVEKGDYLALIQLQKELQQVKEAVGSAEVMAVKKQFDRLELAAKDTIGIGNKKKADKICAAVCAVPLLDRLHIFTNDKNVHCKRVSDELKEHRIFGFGPAKSFSNIAKDLKNKIHELRDEGEQDADKTQLSEAPNNN